MALYLVQHGEALSKEVDPERRLSERGRDDVGRLAQALAKRGLAIARVQHSGKPRARETAELLGAALGPGAVVEAVDGLAPNDPVEAFAQGLEGAGDDPGDGRLVVGHLPFMARLVAHLVAGDAAADVVAYEPGSLVCLEKRATGGWTIAWMLRPELLS